MIFILLECFVLRQFSYVAQVKENYRVRSAQMRRDGVLFASTGAHCGARLWMVVEHPWNPHPQIQQSKDSLLSFQN